MQYAGLLSATLVFTAAAAWGQVDTTATTGSGTPPATLTPATSAPDIPSPGGPGGKVPQLQAPASTLPILPLNQMSNLLSTPPDDPAEAPALTVAQAEQAAIAHNPRIAVSRLLSLAAGQQIREQRAADSPALSGNLTAVEAHDGGRITAGGLNNPVLYQRAAAGVTLNQLLTDFGRTRNLITGASLRERAAESTLAATRDDVVFAVDQAFYRALGAQALIRVAAQTVSARQVTADQIQALANARLRSTLDLNFATANLAQAQLLLLDARNQSASAQADLSALMGEMVPVQYRLVDQTPTVPVSAPADPKPLIALAFRTRPDLNSLQQQAEADQRFAAAESDLRRPIVTALGATGGAPVRADQITSSWYGAIGVNVTIPIFNGSLYTARAEEARLRAAAADQQTQQLRVAIVRDVTTTVLQAQSNFSRIAVAQVLEAQANSALALAQTRYNLGLSSIVELSQAQLLQTQAQIELANARYTYQGSVAALRFQTGQ